MLLTVALLAAAAAIAYTLVELDAASTRINEQNQQLEEQQELIDKKQTFGAAMESLVETARAFDGLPFASLVPFDTYDALASVAWRGRWDVAAMNRVTTKVQTAKDDLDARLAAAAAEAASNATGSTDEAVLDRLGSGFVTSLFDNADELCQADVLACVMSESPYVVHFDAADASAEHMNEWIRTGVAYHEFAHVLQFANPEQTETAAQAFGGDFETMADCYALTFLDGWSLDHEVWVSDYAYFEVSVGYGYTCDEGQRQVIRDWHSQLGSPFQPITQS